ncbi:MAG: diacylglycerol/polyprenol kinase family protein [Bacteriovoracia bacterium]
MSLSRSASRPMNRVKALRSDLHLLRKLWHMGSGSICLAIYYSSSFSAQAWGWAILAVAFVGFATDLLRMRSSAINDLVIRVMGPLMRSSEQTGFSGLPFYALGVGLALVLFQPKIALLAIMFLVFSDPISSFFGIIYGKDKIMPNKSLQGAIACFFTCYLLTLFYGIAHGAGGNNLLWFAIIGGVVGSLAEMMSAFNVDDNLTIPVISGLGLTVANYLLQVL